VVNPLKLDLPGLLKEPLPSGAVRWRVRVERQKHLRITLNSTPDQPNFLEHYRAARAGLQLPKGASPSAAAIPKSVAWLTYQYEEALQAKVRAGIMAPATVQQRCAFMARLRKEYGTKEMRMPRAAVMKIRDDLTATPGAADNMIKSIRALYAWAIDMGHVAANPAAAVGKISRGGGAIPWTIDDMTKYRRKHKAGTMAHLAITLLLFTGARLDDVIRLGRANVVERDGIQSLAWTPGKRGSAPVVVPILPPLAAAISAQKLVGPTYLLTEYGRPFASNAAFGNKFRSWVAAAGLTDRSPHGLRKAVAELMALAGASQYHIMAVHGHTQAKTSEIYTKGVNRAKLAAEAMHLMRGMDW
jgi:integrase